jgi:hypothetical protein
MVEARYVEQLGFFRIDRQRADQRIGSTLTRQDMPAMASVVAPLEPSLPSCGGQAPLEG